MSLRRQRLSPSICVDCDLAHSYIPMKPEPKDLTKVQVLIRRADGLDPLEEPRTAKCNPWLLCYPAYDYDAGHVGFRWDEELHELCQGHYIAEIQIDCEPCAWFELVVPHPAQFGGTTKRLTRDEVA